MGGGGGGKGGGGGGGGGQSAEQKATTRFFLENVSKPLADLLVPQIGEALSTGGVGARIPVAQKSVEASRSATSKSLIDIATNLERAGILRTPTGQAVLGQAALSGEQRTRAIPTDIAAALANLAPDLLSNAGRIAIGGPGAPTNPTSGSGAGAFGSFAGGIKDLFSAGFSLFG